MQENTLIYIAGNPDLYPLEYYDAESETYQGAIPELLADFAEDSGYQIVYYQPGSSDRRETLAQQRQVDAVSGVVTGESFPNTGDMLPLFSTEVEGQTVTYGIALTSVAPDGLAEQLADYAGTRSQAAETGEILHAAENMPVEQNVLLPAVIGLGVALCLALCVLLIALRRSRRNRHAWQQERWVDPSTGLLNRAGIEKAFRETINPSNRSLYYMLCFHFELGHIERMSGPGEILRFHDFAADVLRRHAGENGILFRGSNGDFFVLSQSGNNAAAEQWALDALQEIRTYICAGAPLSRRDVSVGICPLSAAHPDLEHLLFHARQCAIAAARDEAGARFCAADVCRACEEERELLNDLEHGLKNDEFQMNLQFFVSAADFTIMGGEALSRWQHPKKGFLNPERFVPLLEQEGRIDRLDLYNLEKSCAFLQKLNEVREEDFYLSCNFSRSTFAQPMLMKRCRDIIERYHFPRRELIIEVTESGYIKAADAPQMRENILSLRSLGVQVMFDDFGMGYSTFHDLQEYPMDGLKLDKSLVDNMGTERGRVLLDGIVRTGHALGLTVLAEGVEELWQVEQLKHLHCDLLQGYYFSVPLPAQEALRRLTQKAKIDSAERGKDTT